jgi:hypothetical protein
MTRGFGRPGGYFHGRALMQRMGQSATNDLPPTLELSLYQCADVLQFTSGSVPIEPESRWQGPKNGPSHLLGAVDALQAVEVALPPPKRGSVMGKASLISPPAQCVSENPSLDVERPMGAARAIAEVMFEVTTTGYSASQGKLPSAPLLRGFLATQT